MGVEPLMWSCDAAMVDLRFLLGHSTLLH